MAVGKALGFLNPSWLLHSENRMDQGPREGRLFRYLIFQDMADADEDRRIDCQELLRCYLVTGCRAASRNCRRCDFGFALCELDSRSCDRRKE